MSSSNIASTVDRLLQELEAQDVRLWADGDKLRFDGPTGALSAARRQLLAQHKQEILARLSRDGKDARIFLLENMQQAYWVGQSAGFELSTVASYYMEADLGPVPAQSVAPALRRLVDRHELLRAIVLPSGEQQILDRVPDYEVEIHDLRALSPAECAARTAALRAGMCEQEMTTDAWPQLAARVSHLRTGVRLHLRFALWMMDAWSLRVFMTELMTLLHDADARLPPIGMSFRDYVAAQRALRRSPRYQAAREYWNARLATFPSAPALPLARSPRSVHRPRFRHLTHTLTRDVWAQLVHRAAGAGLTTSLLLCAAYAEVLARYSRSDHFAITVLYSSRFPHLPRAEHVIGNFGTTLLLEVSWSRHESFLERARRLQGQFWNDLEHIQVSGLEVSRELDRLRGSVGAASIPVTFTTAPSPTGASENVRPAIIDHAGSHLQVPQVYLDHQVFEGADGDAVLNWDHVEQVFPAGFVDSAFHAYVRLVEHLARSDEGWHAAVPQLANHPAPSFPRVSAAALPPGSLLLHDAFDRQARLSPGRLAIESAARTLTYHELHRTAVRLGIELRERGARANTLIAVVMEKGWEQVVAVLAILYAGAAYVPVDPDLPEARRALLLEESDVDIVLTQPWLERSLRWPERVSRISVDTVDDVAGPVPVLGPVQSAEDLAYVIFTSGSTGKPKGVMIDHRGAINTIVDINRRFDVRPGDRIFAISSLSFDLSVYDVFGALAAGATIVFPEARLAKDPFHWLEVIERHEVTIWSSVPALMQLLVESAAAGSVVPSSLRLIMLSGDWIPLSLPPQIHALVSAARVVSLGGATEASIWSILHPIDRLDPEWRSVPYGRAMRNQSVHVLDGALDDCPTWVPGELYIGGIGLAQGYWRDPEKTAASFLVHPRTGDRIYRTGDLGRYLPDGEIEFLGREDFQVKIQGFRVECSEIEAVLVSQPAVKSAAVSAVSDPGGARRLVAYVVLAPGQDDAAIRSALQERLAQSLPGYMVPSAIVVLPGMPLSSNGKVDRKALPAPDWGALGGRAPEFVTPRDTTEARLAELWSEILDVRPIGARDDFFELGGSSFAGMRLMARIHERFGRTLHLSTLIGNPTVERIAALLRGAEAEASGGSVLVPIHAEGGARPLFCVHPVGGNVLCYLELARNLGAGQPVYGLQAQGLVAGSEPLGSIEEMASRYIQAIQAVQPQGPYHLAGWSLGGIVAYEMACRLRDAGHDVAPVVMIDSRLPQPGLAQERSGGTAMLTAFARDIGAMAGTPLDISAAELEAVPADVRFAHVVTRLAQAGALAGHVDELRRLYRVFEANMLALQRYRPRPYAGRVLLLSASEPREPGGHAGQAWTTWARELVMHEIAADHYSIMRGERLERVAESIAQLLIS